MTPTERADLQREAVEHALTLCEIETGYVHVYGAKLYGNPDDGEHHCTAATPFNGSQAGPIVFHVAAQRLGWTDDQWCPACGVHSGGVEH